MFGYIAPDLQRLAENERQTYRAFYCGLCHSLKTRYGETGRLCLSNDMTFLAILLSSLYEPASAENGSRCAFHPLKRHTFRSSRLIDYAADMNVLLFYWKCEDQRRDGHSLSGGAAEKTFREKAARVRDMHPVQSAQAERALARLWEEEKAPAPDPDLLCNLSGEMLGACFVPDPEDCWAPQLRAVGEGLGRFVYWMDAWEDLGPDIRAGRFNPLKRYRGREDYEDFCRETLEMLIAEAVEHFEVLPLENDLGILRSILYGGVWQRYTLGYKKRYGKEENPRDK